MLAFSKEWLPRIQREKHEYVHLQLATHTICAYLAKTKQCPASLSHISKGEIMIFVKSGLALKLASQKLLI